MSYIVGLFLSVKWFHMLVFCLFFFFLFLLSFFPFARWRCSCSLLFAPQTSSRSHTHTRHTAVSHSIYNPGHNAYKLIQHGNVFSKVHLYYFLHLSFFFLLFTSVMCSIQQMVLKWIFCWTLLLLQLLPLSM